MVTSKKVLQYCYFICMFTLVACASTSKSEVLETAIDDNGSPKWVAQGSRPLKSSNTRVFHGVGHAEPGGDLSKQITIADRRAKAEMGKILSSYMKIVSRNYIASGEGKNTGFDHYQAAQHINAITRNNLQIARIVGHWRDSKDNTIYSVAELNLGQVTNTLKPQVMDNGFISYFRLKSNTIFDNIAIVKK